MKYRIGIPTALVLSMISINANAIPKDNLMYLHETWSGAYFGTHFGSGAGDFDGSLSDSTDLNQATITTTTSLATGNTFGWGNLSGHSNGSLADLFVGYNFHPGWWNSRFIIGGQLEGTFFSDIVLYEDGIRYSLSGQRTTALPAGTVTGVIGTEQESFEYSDNLESMFTFIARLGYLATPNLLVYVLGGGAEGHFVISSDEAFDFDTERGQWELGYTVGAGLEYRFNHNWSMRGEYRYIHFNDDRTRVSTDLFTQTAGTTTLIAGSAFTQHLNGDFNFNMGKIGIVYRFDSFPMGK